MTSSNMERSRFQGLFQGRASAHGKMSPSKKATTVSEPATEADWDRHLAGQASLGIVPIREDNCCLFGAVDVDDHSLGDAGCGDLQARCDALGLPLVVCQSTRGGAHLYRFLPEPVPASRLIAELRAALGALGLPAATEVFPKQASVALGSVGNWISLPYHGEHARYAVDAAGQPVSLAAFLDRAEAARARPWPLSDDVWADGFADGPDCMRECHAEGAPPGRRNVMVFNVGAYARDLGRDDWREQVERYNAALADPLGAKEIASIVKSVKAKDYSVQCMGPGSKCPTAGTCKLKARLARAGGPVIRKLRKIDTRPPTWEIEVDGTFIPVPDTGFLQQPSRLEGLIIDALNRRLPGEVKANWGPVLDRLLAEVETVAAPEDASESGRLWSHVEDFLQLYHRSDSLDDILLHKPALDPETGRICFLGQDLIRFLDGGNRWKVGKEGHNELWRMLRERGAGYDAKQRRLKGRRVRLWWVPLELVEEQTEPFDLPRSKAIV